jgi:hypothetical protein
MDTRRRSRPLRFSPDRRLTRTGVRGHLGGTADVCQRIPLFELPISPQPAWHQHGDPGGGAIAGAIIGGILGGGHGASALPGAAGGAVIGAAASDGHSDARFYDVAVRFQDGSQQVFRYADYAPFRPGEEVVQTPQGLARS